MIKTLLLTLGLLAPALAPAWGQDETQPPPIVQAQFLGVNDTDASISIGNEAQSALNVESSLNGTALLKRYGYSRTASLAVSTSAATGVYSFVDPNGNKQQVVCQDHNCAKSTNSSAFVVFLSTAGGTCLPTRWQFAQIGGYLYGVNDCHDVPFRYDGTTFISLSSSVPSGSIIEATKDRLVISGASANPSAVYYSQSGTPGNFITGINSADPYVDVIGASGDQVRALKWALGRLFIFKTSSITSCILGDQYTSVCYPVSNTVGTSDPLAVLEVPGGASPQGATSGALLFRGSDTNFWSLDQTGINVISKRISNLVASQTSGSNQSNTQTSQVDWQAGSQSPSGSWNTTFVNGSVLPSSSSFVDATLASFVTGTLVNTSTRATPSVVLAIATGPVTDSYLSSAGAWSVTDGNVAATLTSKAKLISNGGSVTTTCGTYTAACPFGEATCGFVSGTNGCAGCATVGMTITLYDGNTKSLLTTFNDNVGGNGTSKTFSHAINGVEISSSVYVCFSPYEGGIYYCTQGINNPGYVYEKTATPDGFTVTYDAYANCATPGANHEGYATASNVKISSYSPTGAYTSPSFDTTFSTPTMGVASISFTSGSPVGLTFQQENSADNSSWSSPTTLTPGSGASGSKRYWRYLANYTTTNGTMTAVLNGLTSLTAATTGQFITQCIQPGPGISSWGTFSCAQTLAGAGSEVFYATSAASCGALPTAPPVNPSNAVQSGWTAQTNNATMTISTNAAVYLGWRSLLGSATDQAQIDACTLYWTNGAQAPPSWAAYDPVKNAAYWTSAISNSATANRVLKYDLNLNEWYPFGLNATALYRDANQNAIYFGDSTGGYWNKYGGVTSDNGGAINAYWISRDFGNQISPFLDNSYNRISLVTKNQVTGSMTVGYTFNTGQTGSYVVSLSTTSGIVYVHANQNLLRASPYQFMNVNLGNNSTTGFEVDALRIDMTSFGWKPQNP